MTPTAVALLVAGTAAFSARCGLLGKCKIVITDTPKLQHLFLQKKTGVILSSVSYNPVGALDSDPYVKEHMKDHEVKDVESIPGAPSATTYTFRRHGTGGIWRVRNFPDADGLCVEVTRYFLRPVSVFHVTLDGKETEVFD